MSATMLHLLDSLHEWLQWVTGLSAAVAAIALAAHLPISIEYHSEGEKRAEMRWWAWRVAFVAAALFACAGTLLVFVPTAKDVRLMRLEEGK